MSPNEYRAALETLGLSQLAAGRWLGVSPKTAQNYTTRGPSGPAARAVQMLLAMRRPEIIIAAAHLYTFPYSEDPRAVPAIVSAPPPARHHNLFALAGEPDESGFLTSTGRFVDRETALQIALASGQPMIDHPSRHARLLFSEDLW